MESLESSEQHLRQSDTSSAVKIKQNTSHTFFLKHLTSYYFLMWYFKTEVLNHPKYMSSAIPISVFSCIATFDELQKP